MDGFELTNDEKALLLKHARQALECGVRGEPLEPLDLSKLPTVFKTHAATFVTLTKDGMLRGCIGALEATISLVEDARQHAVAAALQDYRFPPVQPSELGDIRLELSILTPLERLDYTEPGDLPKLIQPGVDGVVLRQDWQRATFLPQVWEKIPSPEDFLSRLCEKMGAQPDLWRRKTLSVFTYRVIKIHEEENTDT
ncbi:MAG: AmmeMemoRadiSam system protein A [Chloroflexota bacterium]